MASVEKILEGLLTVLTNFVIRLGELYKQSWGDADSSDAGDAVIPVNPSDAFVPLFNISISAKICIQNLSLTDELQLAFNDKKAVGWRLSPGIAQVFDAISGTVYGKCTDPTKTITLNYLVIGINTK